LAGALGILEMFSLPLSSALLFSIAWQQMVTHGTRSMCPTALLPLLACPILATTSMGAKAPRLHMGSRVYSIRKEL
jgi:hypothetical protein